MQFTVLRQTFCALFLIAAALTSARVASALPSNVNITPPNGARFLSGQRFDLRVEGKGVGPFSATLSIDGVPQTFTSGAQNTTTTDGITVAGYGGFNLRGYSNTAPGTHTITATFSDSTGSVTVSAQFEIIDVRGNLTKTRNIIIMLGDGMGIQHRTAARLVRYGVTNGRPNGFLAMDQFPGTGVVTTHSLNTIITDSAPGMSCYSSGNHNQNGQEGVYPANVVNPFFAPRVEYMAEYLHRTLGKSLGLVTTADVEDATPAANAVHTANRNAGQGVCDQYLDEADAANTKQFGTGLTVLMGGGRRWFLPAGQFGSSRSSSNDYPALPADLVAAWKLPVAGAVDPNRDLIGDFTKAGFTYVDSFSALKQAGAPDKLLGLFAFGNMNVALDKISKRRGVLLPGQTSFIVDDYHAPDQPMLNEMTDAALNVLNKNPNGFVLMVEGAHIDKQSHLMDAERAIGETLEFDDAVASVRRFADRSGDTIIIVTADHECSGFTIIGALTGGVNNLRTLAPDTATLDPTVQPNRQKVVGTYDAAGFPIYTIQADGYPRTFDVEGKLLIGFGANGDRFETWLTKPLPVIDSLLSNDIKAELDAKNYARDPVSRKSDVNGYFIRGQATGRDQAVHTASDIPISVYSSGNRAYTAFYGVQENTDIFFKLMSAALGGYDKFLNVSGNLLNPTPSITSISPASATAGGSAFTLTINGANFVNGSTVRVNGADRPTTYLSDTQLAAQINASDIASAGTLSLTVSNPAPGGGTSSAFGFTVAANPTSIQFAMEKYRVGEGDGAVQIQVTRTGDSSQPATVNYATRNGTASDRSKYTAAFGTLRFAAGETTKTISIFIIDNATVEGDQTFSVVLSNPSGAALGNPSTTVVTIADNDIQPSAANPIDDPMFFVKQQYIDFFARQADSNGLAFWTSQYMTLTGACNTITDTEAKRRCVLSARAQISSAFLLSTEFQQTGYYVIRFYAVTFGRLPTISEFLSDVQDVSRGVIGGAPGADAQLEANKAAFANNWVNRVDVRARLDSLSNGDYVNTLLTNGGAGANDETALRSSLITGLNNSTETRATALRKIVESKTVYNRQFNPSLVLIQYFGYLRRNPDTNGFNSWVGILNQASNSNEDTTDPNVALTRIRRAQIIEAFIDSAEYRARFGNTKAHQADTN
jgi:alkaline phosphatase